MRQRIRCRRTDEGLGFSIPERAVNFGGPEALSCLSSHSRPVSLGGRPTLLCFAIDVTERNALRREFLEATDLQRRRLADELRYGFGRTLGELEIGATRLEQSAGTGKVDSAAIALIARSSQRAVEVCREMAHSAASAPRFDPIGPSEPRRSAAERWRPASSRRRADSSRE